MVKQLWQMCRALGRFVESASYVILLLERSLLQTLTDNVSFGTVPVMIILLNPRDNQVNLMVRFLPPS